MSNRNANKLPAILMHRGEVTSVKDAIYRTGKSERWVRTVCQQYGLARQTVPHAPLEISMPALEMVLHGDFEALERLRKGDRNHETVRRYLVHLSLLDRLA